VARTLSCLAPVSPRSEPGAPSPEQVELRVGCINSIAVVHQQYLAIRPNGYRCHSNTGVPFPIGN